MKTWAVIALALILAACGGAGADTDEGVASLEESSTTSTVAEESADPEAAAMAFTACMRENGVDMEDPTVDADGNVVPGRPTDLFEPGEGEGPGGEFAEELRSAFDECGDLLEGTTFGFTPEDQTELQDQLLELAQCLRDQGLDVADPDLSAGPGEGGGGPGRQFGIDFQDPEVQAALEQCEEFMPNFGGVGGPGGAPPADGDN